jgi:hypothetical protein
MGYAEKMDGIWKGYLSALPKGVRFRPPRFDEGKSLIIRHVKRSTDKLCAKIRACNMQHDL